MNKNCLKCFFRIQTNFPVVIYLPYPIPLFPTSLIMRLYATKDHKINQSLLNVFFTTFRSSNPLYNVP